MEIKSVRITEIHWSIGWNASQQANKRLKEVLGDTSKYFAMLKVGNATYNWTVDTVGQWQPVGMAPTDILTDVLLKVEDVRQEVYAKLGANQSLAEKICQVPNYEEYIFYKDNGNQCYDIAITGWGFHNFKRPGAIGGISWPPLPKKSTTTISFSDDGQKQAGRAFSLVTPKMRKPYVTDAQGLWTLESLGGKTFTVIDDLTGRQFTITTADHDSEFDFDVTTPKTPVPPSVTDEPKTPHPDPAVDKPVQVGESDTGDLPEPEEEKAPTCQLTVIATLDDQPICGEIVSIIYDRQHYDLLLQADGKATIADMPFSGGNCYAKLPANTAEGKAHAEAEADLVLKESEENIITFELQSETPPPAMVKLTVIDSNGIPMKDARYTIAQGPEHVDGKLDDMGATTFERTPFITERPLKLSLVTAGKRAISDISFNLDADEDEYLLQEEAPQEGNRLLEILAAIVLLFGLVKLLMYAFTPGIAELTKLINKNIF